MKKMEITLKDLENNIRTLPENFYEEVNDFIDFLKYKHIKIKKTDVPEWQKEEVRRRIKYSQDNPQSFVSESEMDDYLNDLESGD
jgi:DNA replication initiation complex subunit (GINS family)